LVARPWKIFIQLMEVLVILKLS